MSIPVLARALLIAVVAAVAVPAAGQEGVDRFGDPLPHGAVARLGTIRLRHAEAVHDVAFSPDGKLFASIDANGAITVWEAPSGTPLHRLSGNAPIGWTKRPHDRGNQLAFESNTSLVFLIGATPFRWKVGQPLSLTLGNINGATPQVQPPLLSPRGRFILALAAEHFELRESSGSVRARFRLGDNPPAEPRGRPFVAAFSSDEKQLALYLQDDSILIHDLKSGDQRKLKGHEGVCTALAFLPDGKTLLSAGESLHEWDLAKGTLRRSVAVDPEARKARPRVERIVYSPDGKHIAVHVDRHLTQWDAATFKPGWSARIRGSVFAYAPDGRHVALAGDFTRLQMLDAKTGTSIHPDVDAANVGALMHFCPDGQSIFTPSAHGLIYTDSYETRTQQFVHLKEWSLRSGAQTRSVRYPVTNLDNVAFTPNGRRAAAQTSRKTKQPLEAQIALWDAVTGKRVRELAPIKLPLAKNENDAGRVKLLTIAERGDKLAFALGDEVHVWNLERAERAPAYTLDLKDDKSDNWRISSVAFAPDGKLLQIRRQARVFAVVGIVRRRVDAPSEVRFYDAETGKRLPLFQDQDRGDVTFERNCQWSVFSPDGRFLASDWLQSSYGLQLWDVRQGRLAPALAKYREMGLVAFAPDKEVDHFAFAPDSRSFAIAIQGGSIALWEIATANPLKINTFQIVDGRRVGGNPSGVRQQWSAHDGDIRALRYTPDGRHLLSQGPAGDVLVWDLQALRPPHRLELPGSSLPWQELAEPDAFGGYAAMTPFLLRRQEGMKFLREKLQPVPAIDRSQVGRWIADLNSGRFETREQAMRALERHLPIAYDALVEARRKPVSLEVRRRIDDLLEPAKLDGLQRERFRSARAVEILELIGDSEARAILRAAAKGDPQAHLTQVAQEACARLDRPRD